MSLASLTTTLADSSVSHGIPAVFALMGVDALLPTASELVMLLAGAVAAGAIGHGTARLAPGPATCPALSFAGTLGYRCGAVVGWVVGRRGGRDLVVRRGRWLHLGPERMPRAECWFARYGRSAVLLGRLTPVARSFVSIPAGVVGAPLGLYVVLTAPESAIWCFGFAGARRALGANWEAAHAAFRYVEAAVLAALVAGVGRVLARRRVAIG